MKIFYSINTDEYIESNIKRLGLFMKSEFTGFFELCEVTYPLPEAPENAKCNILEWRKITIPQGTEQLIDQSIKAMAGITKFTELV